MRFHRRTLPRWLIAVPIVLLFLLAGGYAISRGRPHPVGFFPAPEAIAVPAPAPIVLTFDRAMHPGSLENALQTEPARTGESAWDEEALTFTFTPADPWPRGVFITFTLTTEARTASGIRLAEPVTWSFKTASTLLAYLWPADDTAPADLYALDPDSGDSLRLTTTEFGVLDYAPAPDGLTVLVSLANAQGGADLAILSLLDHALTPLLDCAARLCRNPQIDPSGMWIAYEDATRQQIHLLPLFGEPALLGPGRFPAWSSDTTLLYFNPDEPAYISYNPVTGTRHTAPNDTGDPAAWLPNADEFIAPEILTVPGGLFASHLARYLVTGGPPADLTLDPNADDNAPAVSPDGTRLAFARRFLDTERWTPGRQLWLMTTAGGNPHPLTDAPLYGYTSPAWHPDGTQIACVRSNLADLNEPPEIWLINADGSTALALVINAFAPQWLP